MKKITIPFWKKRTIRLQIQVIFVLTSLLPILVVGLFSIGNARSQMLEHYRTQLETELVRVNSTLFDITISIRTSTAQICEDNENRRLFMEEYGASTQRKFDELEQYLGYYQDRTAGVNQVRIYTNNMSLPESERIIKGSFEEEPWYQNLADSEPNRWMTLEYEDRFGNKSTELTLVEEFLFPKSEYSAYLVTRIDNNYLRNRMLTSNSMVMISLDDSDIFFANDRNQINQEMYRSSEFLNSNYHYRGSMDLEGEQILVYIASFTPYQTNNHFYTMVGDLDAYENVNDITKTYILILLLAALVPIIIIFGFSKHFSKRVETLRIAMHQASQGDYNIIDNFSGDDELTETFQDLKKTVDYIHDQEARYYEAQLSQEQLATSQQKMKFKILASQINPHFLYNTMETIRMQAINNEDREVANSVNLLGRSMRYVLENTGENLTTLELELEHVRTYLQIQKLRFGDRVNYAIHVPPYVDSSQIRMPALLLQPIVENAIVHGLEGVTEHGLVEIRLILEEPDLYLLVTDNGEGMDEETVQKLQKNIEQLGKSKRSSIALKNINERLKLAYGEEYHLSIESQIGEGTAVTIPFPLVKICSQEEVEEMLERRDQYLDQDMEEDDI